MQIIVLSKCRSHLSVVSICNVFCVGRLLWLIVTWVGVWYSKELVTYSHFAFGQLELETAKCDIFLLTI